MYRSPPGYHRHKCKFCSFTWEHHDCNDIRHGDYGAHECPGCHRCNWSLGIYEGDDPPLITNGQVPSEEQFRQYTIHPDQNHASQV